MIFDRRTVLSFAVVIAFVAAVFTWMLVPPETTAENQTVLNMLLGALIASFTTVIAFDFGSSSGSKAKDDALIDASKTPPPPSEASKS